jgi:cytochrome c oxidase cbb3-type subunit I/II
MQTLGVPYPEGFDKESEAAYLKQAQLITDELKLSGIDVAPNKEIIAIIAYLQRLGKDISQAPKSQN